MTSLALRRARAEDRARSGGRSDDGIAMIMVVSMCFIIFMFITAMFTAVLNTQLKSRYQGDITQAQTAAEAGVNDWVFQINRRNSNGQQNWDYLPTLYTSASPSPWTPIGNAEFRGYYKTTASPNKLEIWMTGRYPTGSNGDTRTLKVTVAREAPPAFGFSMFASKGIDLHHHGSSPLSPQIVTNSVHSNGYINIDYSSEFTVNTIEAVTTLTFQKNGTIWSPVTYDGTGHYYWLDQATNTCYPGGYAPPCPRTYSPYATINGDVRAATVVMGNKANVLPVQPNTKTETGLSVSGPGNVYAGSATLNGTTYSTPGVYQSPTSSPPCAQCGFGAGASAGQIAGSLHIQAGYAPSVVPFPSVDYSTTFRTRPGVHIFPDASTFLSTITNPLNGYYRKVDNSGNLQTWTSADTAPQVILLDGDWYIDSGNLSLDWGTLKSLANSKTGKTGPAPILVVRGSLVVANGSIGLKGALILVGKNNPLNFLRWQGGTGPGTPGSWPSAVDTPTLLSNLATEPGVLAAGGTIDASDYDTDSTWTDPSKYEPVKATPIYIRGLVYAAKWDPTTKTSLPQNMHWHNYDPKNITKIFGAQVGAQLHDCNSFNFTYDPLVQLAFGFGAAGIAKIVDYQEIGR